MASEAARVRISKVTDRRTGATISILNTPPPDDEDRTFVNTLVWLLGEARRGNVVGYAIVCTIETQNGTETRQKCIEAAKAWSDGEEHHVLGLMRRMELSYINRTWPDE